MLRPAFAFAAAVAVLAVLAAARSVAAPVALASLPVVFIALLGRNPLPNGAIAMFVSAWIALAIVLAVAREEDALPVRAVVSIPVVCSLALLALMTVRLGVSPSPEYGSVKLRLFLAQNVILLLAGILIGRRRRHMDLFAALTLIVSFATALVLVRGLVTGHGLATLGGRFSLYQDESPIGLARTASVGLIVAVYVLLWSHRGWLRFLALIAGPVIAVAFFATGSRGPVLGLVVALVVLLVLTLRDPQSRRRLLLLSLTAPVAAFLVTSLVPAADIQRSLSFLLFGNFSAETSNGRYQLWHEAYAAFHAHPLWGIGTGGFPSLDPSDLYPHDLFLEVGAELGALGVVLVVLTVGVAAIYLAQSSLRTFGEDRGHAALASALFAAAFVNALVSSDIAGNNAVWLAAGLGLGLYLRQTAAEGELSGFNRPWG